jgi:hypothetical protein
MSDDQSVRGSRLPTAIRIVQLHALCIPSKDSTQQTISGLIPFVTRRSLLPADGAFHRHQVMLCRFLRSELSVLSSTFLATLDPIGCTNGLRLPHLANNIAVITTVSARFHGIV